MAEPTLASAVGKWLCSRQPGQGCVLLVRHGATVWNAERRLQGQTDTPLSPLGVNQAGEVAGAIAVIEPKPVVVYTSPLTRARVTAETIAQPLSVPVKFCNGLLERAFGAMEGLATAEIHQYYPNWRDDENSVPGMEHFVDLQQRAVGTIAGLLDEHPDQLFVAVSHGAFINAFLAEVSTGAVGTGKTNLANGGISVVWRTAASWQLGAINLSAHLSDPTGQTLTNK